MGILKEYAGKKPALGRARLPRGDRRGDRRRRPRGRRVGLVQLGRPRRLPLHPDRRALQHPGQLRDPRHRRERIPTILEEEVTLGHGAIVHGATVRRGALIGIRATVMDGADVGESAFIGAGALVTPRTDRAAAHALAGRRRRGRSASSPTPRSRTCGTTTSTTWATKRSTSRSTGRGRGERCRLRAPKGTHDLLPARQREVRGRRGGGPPGLRVLRVRRDPHADLRVDGALRAFGRRDDRHRPQGDVHVPGSQGPVADAAAGEHGRASCAPSSSAGSQDMPRPIRLWYAGPQFRYEQPQAGRYREFRQIGVELLGRRGPRPATPRS